MCGELSAKIAHYRWFTTQSFDLLTRHRIAGLIDDLEHIRGSMHFEEAPFAETFQRSP
jgi:hypothetical protein